MLAMDLERNWKHAKSKTLKGCLVIKKYWEGCAKASINEVRKDIDLKDKRKLKDVSKFYIYIMDNWKSPKERLNSQMIS